MAHGARVLFSANRPMPIPVLCTRYGHPVLPAGPLTTEGSRRFWKVREASVAFQTEKRDRVHARTSPGAAFLRAFLRAACPLAYALPVPLASPVGPP